MKKTRATLGAAKGGRRDAVMLNKGRWGSRAEWGLDLDKSLSPFFTPHICSACLTSLHSSDLAFSQETPRGKETRGLEPLEH